MGKTYAKFKKILKIVIYLLAFLIIGIPILLILLLEVPSIQEYALHKIQSGLSEKINSKVGIKHVQLYFPNGIRLEEIYIEDQWKDTLVYAHELKVDINFLKLLNKEVKISEVELSNAFVNVYRKSSQKEFNYDFITKAFVSTDTTNTKSAWTVDLQKVRLSHVRLNFKDIPGGFLFHSGIPEATVNFKTLGLEDKHLVANNISLKDAVVAVDLLKPELKIKRKKRTSNAAFQITLKKIQLDNSRIVYNDFTKPKVKSGIDYNRLDIKKLSGKIDDASINDSKFFIDLNQLSLNEKSGLVIQDIAGTLLIDKENIHLNLDKLLTPNSNIHNQVTTLIPLDTNKNENISFSGNFNKEVLAIKDLTYFFSELQAINQLKNKRIVFSGKLNGKLMDFRFQNMFISLDKRNNIQGNVRITGLPSISESYVNIDLKKLLVESSLIQSFANLKDTTLNINGLGQILLTGKIAGSPSQSLSGKLVGVTSAGKISVDGKIKLDKSFQLTYLDGTASTELFDVSKILKNAGMGKVSMVATGKGNQNDVEAFSIIGTSIEYKNYVYSDISVSGSMKDKVVHSLISTKDKSISSEISLIADLNKNNYSIQGQISKFDLYATNMYPSPLVITSGINASVSGMTVDSIIGFAKLNNLLLSDGYLSFALDSLVADAKMKDGNHTIQVVSPLFQGQINGHYDMAELPGVLDYLIDQYYSNHKLPLKNKLKNTEKFEVYFKGGDLTTLAQLFNKEIKSIDSTSLYISFNKSRNLFTVNSTIRNFELNNSKLNGLKLLVNGEGDSLHYNFSAIHLAFGNGILITTPTIFGDLTSGISHFNIKMHDQKSTTRLNLDGIVTLAGDSVRLRIPQSTIFVKGQEWKLDHNNSILFAKNSINVQNLNFTQKDQIISVNSHGSINSNQVEAIFKKVDLNQIAELAGISSYGIKGYLNGRIQASNLFTNQVVEAGLRVDSFYLNHQQLGNLSLKGNKISTNNFVNLELKLIGQGNDVAVSGVYNLSNKELGFHIHIAPLQLHPFEPFVKSFAYHIAGSITGDLQLNGTIDKPLLVGEVNFNKGDELGLTASHTKYKINDQKIEFTTTAINFNQFVLIDSLHNEANLKGTILHDHFKDIKFALRFDTDNFQLINSGYSANASVYGKLNAQVHANLNGPLDDLKIRLFILALKGTQLYVPLTANQASDITPGYIHFNKIEPVGIRLTDFSDSVNATNKLKLTHKVDLSKFDIAGQFKLTKDSEINIIIDPSNGDKITARGDGLFSLDFDSQNNINLYGTYTIDNGSYSFSFVNIIKKDFKIDKGSTISWTGDPSNATLNITAIYETRASRYELLDDQESYMTKDQSEAAKRPLPVDVYLSVTGVLTTPIISFDIKVPEGSDPLTGNLVVQKINQIKSDPNELNKQVFSLIVTNKFMSTQGSSVTNSGNNVALSEVNRSVSKILNSQLNRLSDDYLKGIDINVNIQSLDQTTYGTFAQNAQIMATKELNSRISVSAGGNVNVNSSYGTNQFAGDYTIYYKLNTSGTVSLKFFRTNLQNIYTTNLYTQQGFSMNLKREYNKWSNLFKRVRRRNEEDYY